MCKSVSPNSQVDRTAPFVRRMRAPSTRLLPSHVLEVLKVALMQGPPNVEQHAGRQHAGEHQQLAVELRRLLLDITSALAVERDQCVGLAVRIDLVCQHHPDAAGHTLHTRAELEPLVLVHLYLHESVEEKALTHTVDARGGDDTHRAMDFAESPQAVRVQRNAVVVVDVHEEHGLAVGIGWVA